MLHIQFTKIVTANICEERDTQDISQSKNTKAFVYGFIRPWFFYVFLINLLFICFGEHKSHLFININTKACEIIINNVND